jgi:hypothetical protein
VRNNQPRTNTPLLEEARRQKEQRAFRTAEEVERAAKFDLQQQALIAASLDFLYAASEDALRQQTRRLLRIKSQPCPNKPTSSSPTSA